MAKSLGMNRRKAVSRIFLIGAGTASVYAGGRAYNLLKVADLGRLDAHQSLIDELAETIIPRTNTPGAKDANVGLFVSKMIRDCTGRRSQNNFINGLDQLAAQSLLECGRSFEKCSTLQKVHILRYFERKGAVKKGLFGKAQRYLTGDPFFETLKKYTVQGYCTSKEGATKGLSYDFIPTKYNGCITMTPEQKTWATH